MSNPFAGDRFTKLAVGQQAERSRTVTDEDIRRFADATGDYNPVHLDDAEGRRSMFGSRVAHGVLSAGFVSAVIAMELPGPGTVYLSQSLRFIRPVRIGDVITAKVEVTGLDIARRRAVLRTVCVNQMEETVLEGEAVVLVP